MAKWKRWGKLQWRRMRLILIVQIKINMQKLIKIQNKSKSAKIRSSSDYGINEKKISEFICINNYNKLLI